MKNNIFLIVFLFISFNVMAQNGCGTPSDFPNNSFTDSLTTYSHNEEIYCIDIAFHIVRPSDGSGGFDSDDLFLTKNIWTLKTNKPHKF